MNLSVGIVGLPNVGKSTLFNALLKKQQALAANYPFATIEPNIGIVPVPDQRLEEIAAITKKENGMADLPPIKNATVEFVDIAGLVKGASEGEGLGNKFLSHIRQVNIIAHIVRVFEDPSVIREGSEDFLSDYTTIQTELILSDLATIANASQKTGKGATNQMVLLDKLTNHLDAGNPARTLEYSDEEIEIARQLFLLTNKKEIIVFNVSEEFYSEDLMNEIINDYSKKLNVKKEDCIVVSAKIEAELLELDEESRKEYLEELGVEKSGLERLIKKSYEKLNLISFLTCGEIEVKAWTINKGATAVLASGAIHTDFMDRFIKAEIVSYNDFIECGGWKRARESGKARLEGKDYVMQNGDIVEFKIGR